MSNPAREFLESPVTEAEAAFFTDLCGFAVRPGESRKSVLDRKLLLMAETDHKAKELARRYGIGELHE